jgi:hypothetical protein
LERGGNSEREDYVSKLKASREETPGEAASAVPPLVGEDANNLLFSCSSDNTIKVWRQSSTLTISDKPLSMLSQGTRV